MRSSSLRHIWICLIGMVFCLGQMGAAYSKPTDNKKTALPAAAWSLSKSLHDLGSTALSLKGDEAQHKIYVGVRSDTVVTAAQLVLNISASPSLQNRRSHLIIKLNGQMVTVVPVNGLNAESKQQRVVIDLNPRLWIDDNWLSLTLIGHYTEAHCEDPRDSSIWVEIDPKSSQLQMQMSALAVPDDLSFLPSPWMDRRDQRGISANIVTSSTPDLPTLKAAAVLASWLGSLSNGAPVRIHFWRDKLPADHAIVLTTTQAATTPRLRIVDHPRLQNAKLLLIEGLDGNALLHAAQGLITNKNALSGGVAEFAKPIELPPPRLAYDSPRWVPSHRVVKLGELVNDPSVLEAASKHPDSIRFNLPLAPDLWQGPRARTMLDLRYQAYSSDAEKEESIMSLVVNGSLVESRRLPKAELAKQSLGSDMTNLWATQPEQQTKFFLTGLRAGEVNLIELNFPLGIKDRDGMCASYLQANRASVRAHSTLDLTGLHHFKKMPDLKVLRNTGFPFTKYADLAQTSVVLPNNPSDAHISTLLNVMSAMGRWGGVAAQRVELVTQDLATAKALTDRDLFVIGTGGLDGMLRTWTAGLSMQNEAAPAAASELSSQAWQRVLKRGLEWLDFGSERVRITGAMALLGQFESPLTRERSVVLLSGSDDQSLLAMASVFVDPARSYRIEGGLMTLRGDVLTALDTSHTYTVGRLPWVMRWGVWVSDHLVWVLLLVFSFLAITLVLLGRWLRTRARLRLSV